MIQLDRRARLLALSLAALAGYVDAIGFIQVGGFFVSFMSGNSTRLAVGMFDAAPDWIKAASLIASFFGGVIGGSLVGRLSRRRHSAVLAVVSLALILAAIGAQWEWAMASALVLAFAMGAENATFERDGEVLVGLTYMTGTFVKAGQRIAGALVGDDPRAWVPHAMLWLALVSGAIVGAAMQTRFGNVALWCAVGVSVVCCAGAFRLDNQAADSLASQA